ncbi:DNA-3-methyladenine glycosylase [Paenibacillus lentus]|uniref:Putative 3-methyladenine DNA glycosylase n=1 Tax=Paenibacillus lentus TaxID=1338368 RepID=A0A3S8RRM6_9BACL|nr:DNA-3-methyladenine glycosylase [Paenibacillus lentus]AZK45483.1 DNA-3-methyladenine glycosylase [Paenibacillus lentus]
MSLTLSQYHEGSPLPPAFYEMTALEAAPLLLGHTLVRRTEEGDIRCRIVETESYGGVEDKGCHAYGGRRTARTEVMFGRGGIAYIYLIYGMYHCLNVVTGAINDPQAVLIRAVAPLTPEDETLMRKYRNTAVKKPVDLSGGPGKLCRGLRIDKSLNGQSLLERGGPLWIEAGRPLTNDVIMQSPRINIAYAEEYAAKPWRFFLRDNPYVPLLDKNVTAFK